MVVLPMKIQAKHLELPISFVAFTFFLPFFFFKGKVNFSDSEEGQVQLVNMFYTALLLVTYFEWHQYPTSPKSCKTHLDVFISFSLIRTWLCFTCTTLGQGEQDIFPLSSQMDAQHRELLLLVLEVLEAGAELVKPSGAAGIIHDRISLSLSPAAL